MIDILLLVLLGVGFVMGLISGAVKQLISLVAFVAGYIIACLYYQKVGEMLDSYLPMPSVRNVVAFLLLWVVVLIVARLLGSLLTSLLDKLFGLGYLNRLLGGILGLAKFALVLGTIVWFFSFTNLIGEEAMQQSKLCGPLKAIPESVYNILKAPSPTLQEGHES